MTAAMDPVITFRSAVALVGRFPVLAGVDFEVAAGEIVAVAGANGAGKTSLLRACAGLLPVVAGEARVLGEDLVANPRAVRRRVGMLGHATFLYDDLSVADNLRFAVRAARGSQASVAPAMERLGLTGRLPETPVGSLSAGQRRRAALAVIAARDPELWLLDEPHAGLDSEHREVLDSLIRDAASRGATVVLASHEHQRVASIAARTVTLAGGAALEAAGSQPTPIAPRSAAHVA